VYGKKIFEQAKNPLDAFDQTHYKFRHNGMLCPALAKSGRVFCIQNRERPMTETRPTRTRRAPARAPDESSGPPHINEGPPDESPLDYMLRIMRDTTAEDARRDTMAKAACAYIHSRSAEAEGGIMNTQEFRDLMETSRESIASSIARLQTGTV
jgi:hypothetical protein